MVSSILLLTTVYFAARYQTGQAGDSDFANWPLCRVVQFAGATV